MKRFTLIFLGLILSTTFVMAGGLVHNTNQSAAWARIMSRSATLDIDAVYYNPAGLVHLKDGFHISVSNQSIFQTQTIKSSYPYLNNGDYEGKIGAPVFPSVYFAYKHGKFAISAGFFPIGGGGGADFKNGVPMMEIPISSLVPAFASYGVTGYSVDMQFQGTSVYWGLQGGISYALTKNISLFAGARYVMAKNTYKGHIKDIKLNTADGNSVRADDFMTNLGTTAIEGSAQLANTATMMNPLVTAYGQYTFDQAIAATAGDPVLQGQITALRDGLTDLGQTDAGNLTLQAGQATYTGYSEAYLAQGQQLLAGAFLMGDQEGDITQTGTGITPIIGANFTFMENDLSIGLRYEFKTKLELENEVPSYIEDGKTYYKGFITGLDDEGNPVYMFPNGAKTNADIPAMLSVGVDYRIADPLKISLSYHTYFDKNTGWAEDDKSVDNNFWEFGGGLEYSINENFLISAGYLRANTGVNQAYQSNLSYSLSTNTVAAGGAYKINDMFTVNVGGYYVMYEEKSYDYSYTLLDGLTTIPYVDTYTKSTFAVAVGLDIAIGAKK